MANTKPTTTRPPIAMAKTNTMRTTRIEMLCDLDGEGADVDSAATGDGDQ